jgi:hypothetical protein
MATYSNIYIDQGSTYASTIDVKDSNGLPTDLTDYFVRGQMRRTYNSTLFYDFILDIPNPTNGKIVISLSNNISATLKPGRYVYDIEIVHSTLGDVRRVAEGQVDVSPSVTSNDYNPENNSNQTIVYTGGTF